MAIGIVKGLSGVVEGLRNSLRSFRGCWMDIWIVRGLLDVLAESLLGLWYRIFF